MSVTSGPMGWRKRIFRTILVYLAAPYLTVTAIFTLAQRRLIYRPVVSENLSVATLRLDSEQISDVSLQTPDEETLRGWLLRSSRVDESGQKLVVYFPGNSMNRFERLADLQEVASCGYDVLIFDYRGFGDSTGVPTEAALSRDAKATWEFACRDLDYSPEHIVVFGESLGGAVALSLWSEEEPNPPEPQALILSSTFASMTRTVQWNYPWFPFHYLLLDRWPSITRIHRVNCPINILHGSEDQFVPVSESRALAHAAGNRATFVELRGLGHNDVPMHHLRALLKTAE